MFKNLLFIAAAAFLQSCGEATNEKNTSNNPIKKDTASQVAVIADTLPKPTSANINNRFNNITAVISGDKEKAGELVYLFDTLAWANHAKFIDSSWKRLEKKRLLSMQEWGRKEFDAVNKQAKTVFYPFSGPDYLTAHAFFPEADKYIMLGLEPVGKLPDLASFKKGDAADYANDFKKSLGDIFDKSYFITKKMLNDFQAQKVNGLLPVLSFFIKKSGNDILDIKYLVKFNQDSISEVSYDYADKENKPFGVRVDFLQAGKTKSVYYFKYDVSDKKFNDTTVFYKYITKNTEGAITYIKSASYLLHAGFMSNMRKLILKNSIAVIQDDTGIPYKYFQDEGNFDIKLYGQYTRPVSDFPYLKEQKPLQDAFKNDSANIGKLPFHLGYHWGSKKDVIIYAKKRS